MKHHPLILSTQDVQALIAGNKIRHSILAKDVPNHDHYGTKILDWGLSKHPWNDNGVWRYRQQTDVDDSRTFEIKSPFGSPGDQEWQTGMPPVDGMYWVEGLVTPIHYKVADNVGMTDVRWKSMGSILYMKEAWRPDLAGHDINDYVEYIRYVADGARLPIKWKKDYPTYNNRSGAVMPIEYSRIFLEVTEVTCKRVQSITEEEAKAEGVTMGIFRDGPNTMKGEFQLETMSRGCPVGNYKDGYRYNWYQRHGPDSWNNNDWVFSCNWKVLSINGKPDYLK